MGNRDSNAEVVMVRLRAKYKDDVVPVMIEKFGYGSVMAVPRVTKVIVNMGLGEAITEPKIMDHASEEIASITAQRPSITRARKSISNFKLREGMAIGCRVTLRGARMYEFLDRMINLALPRVRDFRGVSAKAFDGRGNYTLGIKDQLVFPEINLSKVQKVKGMNVCIVTTARTDEEGRELLRGLGMPFRQN